MHTEELRSCLKDVLDPELGVNIVDLGLVYEIEMDQEGNVTVIMTLTTPGCPMHNTISAGVSRRLSAEPTVKSVDVQIVWEPAWSPQMMSAAAREILQFL